MLQHNAIVRAALATLALAACATTPPKPPAETTGKAAASKPEAYRPQAGMAKGFQPEKTLTLCKGLTVSNAPRADGERRVVGYTAIARVNGVALLRNPAPKSCLSSAFGNRNGKLHSGIDVQSKPAGPVVAAGSGTIVEARTRDDYGRYVLISHGKDVYTLYAHLASYSSAVREGREVAMGETLGIMGNTAGYKIPIHLHYEVRTGNYATPKKFFGLTPVDILKARGDTAS